MFCVLMHICDFNISQYILCFCSQKSKEQTYKYPMSLKLFYRYICLFVYLKKKKYFNSYKFLLHIYFSLCPLKKRLPIKLNVLFLELCPNKISNDKSTSEKLYIG